jgi:HlyD family secretion protein
MQISSATDRESLPEITLDIKRAPQKKTKQYVMYGLGLLGILAMTAWVVRLKPAAQSVDRSTLVIDSVRRGDMVRAVNAAGTLEPEHVILLTAVVSGRIDLLPVKPGETVTPGTTIIKLSSPDEELAVLQNEQQLSQQLSAQASLKDQITQQQMTEEATIAGLRTQHNAAVRQAEVDDSLGRTRLVAANDIANAHDQANEAKTRLDIELQRLQQMKTAAEEQLRLNDDQLQRLRAIVDAQHQRLTSMDVKPEEGGVLQSLNNLELGQYVNAGTELGRVAQPEKLKAVLHVPDNQAKDIAIGQSVVIDLHNNSTARGHVMRADPAVTGGTVTVEVKMDDALPQGVRADQSVDGTIEIEKLQNVLYVGRPIYGQAENTVGLFQLSPDGGEASRVQVKLGRASVSYVEVLSGLKVNDKIIVSDMSQYDNAQRVRIK